ncbi:MAG: hypothetical protein M1814_002324 [Vezdaea aestivalis]|nr:MAG: hypothetical protein M1814_002324 [Vezdaea aestivalis]
MPSSSSSASSEIISKRERIATIMAPSAPASLAWPQPAEPFESSERHYCEQMVKHICDGCFVDLDLGDLPEELAALQWSLPADYKQGSCFKCKHSLGSSPPVVPVCHPYALILIASARRWNRLGSWDHLPEAVQKLMKLAFKHMWYTWKDKLCELEGDLVDLGTDGAKFDRILNQFKDCIVCQPGEQWAKVYTPTFANGRTCLLYLRHVYNTGGFREETERRVVVEEINPILSGHGGSN